VPAIYQRTETLNMSVYIAAYRFFIYKHFVYMCVFVTVTALLIVDDDNKEAILTYLLTKDMEEMCRRQRRNAGLVRYTEKRNTL